MYQLAKCSCCSSTLEIVYEYIKNDKVEYILPDGRIFYVGVTTTRSTLGLKKYKNRQSLYLVYGASDYSSKHQAGICYGNQQDEG